MSKHYIPLRDLDDGAKHYTFEISGDFVQEALEEDQLPQAGGVAEVDAQKAGTEVLLQGTVHVPVSAVCSRCLESTTVDVNENFTAVLAPRQELKGWEKNEDLELSAEDLDRDSYDGDRIAVDALIRDHILLALPMNPLCNTECEGMVRFPRGAGADSANGGGTEEQNELDPRLAPLLGWKRS